MHSDNALQGLTKRDVSRRTGSWCAVQAAQTRDYPLVMGLTLVTAVMVVAINLVVDLLYAVVDPRVRREGAA